MTEEEANRHVVDLQKQFNAALAQTDTPESTFLEIAILPIFDIATLHMLVRCWIDSGWKGQTESQENALSAKLNRLNGILAEKILNTQGMYILYDTATGLPFLGEPEAHVNVFFERNRTEAAMAAVNKSQGRKLEIKLTPTPKSFLYECLFLYGAKGIMIERYFATTVLTAEELVGESPDYGSVTNPDFVRTMLLFMQERYRETISEEKYRQTEHDMVQTFKKAEFIVPIWKTTEFTEDANIYPHTVSNSERVFLPLFTDRKALLDYVPAYGDWTLTVHAKDLLSIIHRTDYLINPGTTGLIFTRVMMEKFLKEEEKSEDKMETVIQRMKLETARPVYQISHGTIAEELLPLSISKFGGFPYWPKSKRYPTSEGGENLILLAQINFGQMSPDDSLLPKSGILQFFVGSDDLSGLDFDDQTKQDGFRIVYHAGTEPAFSMEEMKSLGIRTTLDTLSDEFYTPFHGEMEICFHRGTDYEDVGTASENVNSWMERLFPGYEVTKGDMERFWSEYPSADGSKMLGNPYFTQDDPRDAQKRYGTNCYDTLLFQIDSDRDISWGDGGVANFFINYDALKRLDFSDVLYNWDCY